MGFILFYYVLKYVEASRVRLIPLVTPVTTICVGALLNDESVPTVVWSGTGLILLGMSVYQWGHLLLRQWRPAGQEY